jgi:hypothetical protein
MQSQPHALSTLNWAGAAHWQFQVHSTYLSHWGYPKLVPIWNQNLDLFCEIQRLSIINLIQQEIRPLWQVDRFTPQLAASLEDVIAVDKSCLDQGCALWESIPAAELTGPDLLFFQSIFPRLIAARNELRVQSDHLRRMGLGVYLTTIC